MKPALHFVGFRGDRKGTLGNDYRSAVRIWGKPSFIHMGNDVRLRRELADGDVVVFANGSESRPSDRNYSDLIAQDPENGV